MVAKLKQARRVVKAILTNPSNHFFLTFFRDYNQSVTKDKMVSQHDGTLGVGSH